MRYIVKCVPERLHYVEQMKIQIPNLEICLDEKRDAMHTFKKSLLMSGEDEVVHLEDDIILTSDFINKIESVIKKRSDNMIQFFSMRKDDLTIGSRYIYGSLFCMNQCVYYPKHYSSKILEFSKIWDRYDTEPNATDYLIADWLKSKKESYWNHIPSLVEHRQVKSIINPRRSTKRQSKTFEND